MKNKTYLIIQSLPQPSPKQTEKQTTLALRGVLRPETAREFLLIGNFIKKKKKCILCCIMHYI